MVGKNNNLDAKGDHKVPDLKPPDVKRPELKRPEVKGPELKQPEMKGPEKKEPERKGIAREKPLIIEPEEIKPSVAKPVMPKLKGEAGKKIDRVRKPERRAVQEQSRLVTLILLLSVIFLASGMSFLVLPLFNIPVPGWLKPVMDFYRSLPLFPE